VLYQDIIGNPRDEPAGETWIFDEIKDFDENSPNMKEFRDEKERGRDAGAAAYKHCWTFAPENPPSKRQVAERVYHIPGFRVIPEIDPLARKQGFRIGARKRYPETVVFIPPGLQAVHLVEMTAF